MKPIVPHRLYHYTCACCAHDIRREMLLKSVQQLSGRTALPLQAQLVWLTDMSPPAHRDALGLTRYAITCDRTQHVFEVEADETIEWYMTYRKRHRAIQVIEQCEGVMPMHWYVSTQPVPVLRELTICKQPSAVSTAEMTLQRRARLQARSRRRCRLIAGSGGGADGSVPQ